MATKRNSSGKNPPPPPDPDAVIGYIEPIEINLEMERSFLEYSMSVIVSRALPDARDEMCIRDRRNPGSRALLTSNILGNGLSKTA